MSRLLKIFYVSRCSEATSAIDVRSIVGGSRLRNRRVGITGALAYTGHHFAQLLEGPTAAVEPLLHLISTDPRHDKVRVLLCQEDPGARQFENWSMHLLDSPELGESVQRLIDEAPPDESLAAQTLARIVTMVRWNNASDLMPLSPDLP